MGELGTRLNLATDRDDLFLLCRGHSSFGVDGLGKKGEGMMGSGKGGNHIKGKGTSVT